MTDTREPILRNYDGRGYVTCPRCHRVWGPMKKVGDRCSVCDPPKSSLGVAFVPPSEGSAGGAL